MNTYLVFNKTDDYGNGLTELVKTTEENAKQYYHHTLVHPEHADTLAIYFDLIEFEEEKERTRDQRFYGQK